MSHGECDKHSEGLTHLPGVADRIKDARGSQDAAAFGFHVFLYRHESIDVEAALRAAPSHELPRGEHPAKQAAFDAFYATAKRDIPHNDDGTHSGTFWHALMCGIDAYLKAAQGLGDTASGSSKDRAAPCAVSSIAPTAWRCKELVHGYVDFTNDEQLAGIREEMPTKWRVEPLYAAPVAVSAIAAPALIERANAVKERLDAYVEKSHNVPLVEMAADAATVIEDLLSRRADGSTKS